MLIKTTAELKRVIGGTPLSNVFENIAPSIEAAKNFIIPFIGSSAYDIAESIENETYSGTIPENLQKEFLFSAQKPIAWKSQHDYIPEGSVIMDNAGIHIQKSNANQTAAWEWQIRDLQKEYMKKAYSSLNELLMFLNKNRDDLSFWKESDAEKQRQLLFVQTPHEFGYFFDIKGSFALLLTIAPDMLLVQRTTIKNALKPTLYKTIADKWRDKIDFSDTERQVFEACKPVIVYFALARRIVTLPATMIPDGVVEFYHSERLNIKSSSIARMELLQSMREQFEANGSDALNSLIDVIPADDDDSNERRQSMWARSEKAIGF